MSQINFQLQHLNLPARDPQKLASWYSTTFGLQVDGNRARGPGALIAFAPGEPINRAADLHVGFLVPSFAKLKEWADRLGGTIKKGPEFTAFQIRDPEGNCVEVYCKTE
jgi:catechol 2,3-dioxygenase-like lactoylglutathione lyase family enzyme